jgi:predicted dehydrogenase
LTEQVKVGLIGCGKQASKHIVSLHKIPGVSVVVSDINTTIARQFAQQVHCDYVDHPDEIFEDDSICAIIICTPTQSHVSLILQGCKNKKHIFCEKPLTESLEDLKPLEKALEDSGTILMVGYIYRFVPVFEECYRMLRDCLIDGSSFILGKPLAAHFRLGGRGSHQAWKHLKLQGGGAINEMLVHMIDLANWFFGPLQDVDVISNRLLLREREINGDVVAADAEDYVFVKCRNRHGLEIYCQADLVTPDFVQYVEIQGENGSFRGSIQPNSPSYVFLKEGRGGYDPGRTDFSFGKRNLIDIQMTSFVNAVVNNKRPDRNTLNDSYHLMKIINKIKEGSEAVDENNSNG